MSEGPSATHFELRKVDERAWLICEVGEDDLAPRAAGHLTMTDDDNVEVVWSHRIPLPASYASAADALEHVKTWSARHAGSTKPIPIPHIPPPTGATRSG